MIEIDGSATAIGIVLAARRLPLVACLLLGGVVADRVSRRAVMVGADLSRLVTQGLLAATADRAARPRCGRSRCWRA